MKIAVFTRWNETSGVSLHAELIVREWIRQGINVNVFAPIKNELTSGGTSKRLKVLDEKWVKRVYYETSRDNGKSFIDLPDKDFSHILIEFYRELPTISLANIINRLNDWDKIIVINHEGDKRYIHRIKPLLDIANKIIVFDHRYINEVLYKCINPLSKKFSIIPYPVLDLNIEEQELYDDTIEKSNKLTFFSFGHQRPVDYYDFIIALREVKEKFNFEIEYKIMRSDGLIEDFKYSWITQWQDRPDIARIYGYLRSAHIHLLPKERTKNVVVSSAAFQTLSSMTPIISPNTRHFELVPEREDGSGPIVRYRNRVDLVYKIIKLVNDDNFRENVINEMKLFIKKNSHIKISKMILKLLE